MSWIYLLIAIIFEVAGTSALKLSYGLTKIYPTLLMVLFYGISFLGLSLALKYMNVSIAYAVWCGVGIVLITIIDMYYFRTHLLVQQYVGIGLVLIGVVLLYWIK